MSEKLTAYLLTIPTLLLIDSTVGWFLSELLMYGGGWAWIPGSVIALGVLLFNGLIIRIYLMDRI